MSNTTVVDDSPLGLSTATLSAGILGALLFALVLYRARKAGPTKVAVEHKVPEPEIQSLDGFDWTTARRNVFRPFKPIYHITMALTGVKPSELITVDEDYTKRVAERRRLYALHGNKVHGVIPDGRGAAAVRELYTYLLHDHLPRRFPTMFKLSPDGKEFTNVATGKVLLTTVPVTGDLAEDDRAAEAALVGLGETIEEDLFFLQKVGDTHQCVAFSCCFPSGFDPSEKLGLGLSAIHDPVPNYERIGPSMERFFSKMEVGKPFRRLNWSVQTHNELYNNGSNHIHEDEDISNLQAKVDINTTNLRVEMQTLTRLPKTNALLFSFKTYLTPMTEVKAEGCGEVFADAIEGLAKGNAPGMWRYKAAIRWGPPVCQYLRS
ncbi:uncharacterized protein CcaverHIS019_0507410 [Cutaneotrichosporon cavernicola]|uniref:HRQ family protein 2 n=1 Tax=Cutaneotrichosporon cavernicola TaxID=279322 RepID=A0AA48L700_9TREE|nr:uncharacterized protein CcaverHIS019_0507410 [Cutaneotrichosporon cavernicola]BEI93113.1 hypothetical protein CcaverHIS019_0507410 [Cutaneotrichosporon cavernicola]BEJ00890.1 hypothetical protein CcaverHIS631_0507470 [Cutaneotrichosporon cavernicola]BEJ08656.1 hypothetical protein CcaverHIS641_0507500 [Cutaneotrichosporon cavernicola]